MCNENRAVFDTKMGILRQTRYTILSVLFFTGEFTVSSSENLPVSRQYILSKKDIFSDNDTVTSSVLLSKSR